jgi:hypothetical protein
MHPAVSTKVLSDGVSHRVVLPDFSHHGNATRYYTYTMRADSVGTVHANTPRQLSTGVPAGRVYPTDTAAGLFVGGENDESFVVARMTVHDGKSYLGDKETQYDFYLEFLDGKKLNGSDTSATALSYNTGSATALAPAIRVVAGDFDNDGASSEVAYIRSDSNNTYRFEILKVSRSGSTFKVSSLFATGVGHRDKNGKNIEGCDVAAGDFNGDGKQEVAAVFNDLSSSDGHATVQVFYWNGSGFSTKYSAVRNNAHRLGGTNASAYTAFYGLIADAGDLNGDGRDEIVYTAPKYGDMTTQSHILLSAWGADDSFNLSEKSMLQTNHGLSGSNGSTYNFLPLSISMAVAPVGNLSGKGKDPNRGAPCADVFLSTATINTYGVYDLYRFKSLVDPNNGNFISFGSSSGTTLDSGTNGWAVGLVTADFAGESLVLDTPTHMVVRDKKSYAATLQTPPYHVDYVPVPWASDPAQPALTNFSYAGGSVAYSKSDTESTANDTLFETRQFAEIGIDGSASGKHTGDQKTGRVYRGHRLFQPGDEHQ